MMVLRTAVAVVCTFMIGITLLQWRMGEPLFWPTLVWASVLLAGIVFERWRYQATGRAVASRFQATGERFEDPETGQTMDVLFDPKTGERRYVKAAVANDATRINV